MTVDSEELIIVHISKRCVAIFESKVPELKKGNLVSAVILCDLEPIPLLIYLAFVVYFNDYLTHLEIQSDLKYFFQATGFVQYFPYACFILLNLFN
jgi:hypothetical protein